jgi:polysaccharide pyruvyl transferase WcaK-like protein
MHARGIRPVVVSHSAEEADARIAREVADMLDSKLGKGEVGRYSREDPYELKKFIAGAAFLVGSRFHSIVAALSCGVPAVLLGWAHKYDMLAQDFGIPELQHRGTDHVEQLLALVDRLSDTRENQICRDLILGRKSIMRESSERMWADIFALLSS